MTPISIYADSLYQSSFSGDIVDLWLIDGASQNSNISIAWSWGGARNLYLEFGWEASIDMSDMVLYATGSQLNPWDVITELQDYVSLFKNNSWYTWIHNVETLLEVSGISPDLWDLYMASVIEYTLSWKNIIYPSWIINKPAYHDAWFNGVNNQIWIKILWNTSSQNTQEIIVNQFSDDIRILWKIVKSSFRRDISQSVYGVIRNINAKTLWSLNVLSTDIDSNLWDMIKYDSWNTSSRWTAIFGDSVLYYWDGSTVRITGASDIKGEKTIVIEGADLYISWDITNADNQGILGIIVIGGSIYINPLVTDIHAILYTDKSIISSFDGINPIPINTSASQIANQLYIKWSIFSENTIGGSRNLDGLWDSDPLCPFYISWSACSTVHEAQIYDLNYLRRYFIYDSDSDGTIESNGDDNPAYGGLRSSWLGAWNALDKFPVIIDYNPAIQQTPPPFFD